MLKRSSVIIDMVGIFVAIIIALFFAADMNKYVTKQRMTSWGPADTLPDLEWVAK